MINQWLSALSTKILYFLPPETAHNVAIKSLRLLPVQNVLGDLDCSEFYQEFFGLKFPHPLGLAAGFDKHAEVFDKLGQLGFSFVEVGSVTPKPQPGNPKPRLFRLREQQAIINRYGFNSEGADNAAKRLTQYPHTCVTGINLGKNKESTDAISDFLYGAKQLAKYADYFTINVSSPNTPGLRNLQTAEALSPIIDGIRAILQRENRDIPLFIKLSPDMTIAQETALIEFLLEKSVNGIIISNTTISREGVENNKYAHEAGGLSGLPLRMRSTEMLRRVYSLTRGKILLIGCGGISTGQDAYEKLCAGANLLQIYTAFIYQGPWIIRRILLELKAILAQKGIKKISDIQGTN